MWIIITTETHYTPGDQRSRDCPGHGYPESYDSVYVPWVFTEEALFLNKLEQLDRQNTVFTAYEATPLKVTKKLSFEVAKGF